MALTSAAQYRASQPLARVGITKNNLLTAAGRLYDSWTAAPLNAPTPGAASSLDASSAGAFIGTPPGVATWIKTFLSAQTAGGTLIIYDRLSQSGGLSGTVTGTVTTNLPTAPLTRHTSGVGVFMAAEVYSLVGTTATTLSVSYTNSAGVAGRTSPLMTFGGASDRLVSSFLPIPLQVGDVGVRSVESVALTASTGTAGNYGITLWKPLGVVPSSVLARAQRFDNMSDMGAWFEGIAPDACLCALQAASTTSTRARSAEVHLIRQV